MSRHRSIRVTLASLAGLLVIVWQAAVSLWDDIGEMCHWTWAMHREACTATLEQRLRLALGRDYEVWKAVSTCVPAERQLLVAYRRDRMGPDLFARMQHVRTLRWPAGIRGVPMHDGSLPSGNERLVDSFVLDLGSDPDGPDTLGCTELARGSDFRLLRVGSAGR